MMNPDDLVFAVSPRTKEDYDPNLMYANITKKFIKTLELAGLSERKEKSKVHTITLRSFRSFVKSTINDITGRDYSEWFIGHKDPYYKKNKQELRDIYKSKCMKYLTFLDYPLLEATGKSIDAELQVKDKQIQYLTSRVESKDKEMQELRDKMAKMEESQLKITELLEVMQIAKSSGGKVGKNSTMLDEKGRVTIGYVDDNNQRVEMKVPLDGFEIDEAGVDVVTSHLPKRRTQK